MTDRAHSHCSSRVTDANRQHVLCISYDRNGRLPEGRYIKAAAIFPAFQNSSHVLWSYQARKRYHLAQSKPCELRPSQEGVPRHVRVHMRCVDIKKNARTSCVAQTAYLVKLICLPSCLIHVYSYPGTVRL